MISKLEILAISMYQTISRPIYTLLDKANINFVKCRYTPSCSVYAKEAINKYGALEGTLIAAKRILRCNPCHPCGHDPLK